MIKEETTVTTDYAVAKNAVNLMLQYVAQYGGYPSKCNGVHIGHEFCLFLKDVLKVK